MSEDPVVVCGGGIASLAAAIALRARGMAVTVYERRLERADDGLGLNLPGNAIAALQTLGLGDRVEVLGAPTGCREYRNAHGRLLFAVDEVTLDTGEQVLAGAVIGNAGHATAPVWAQGD